MDPSTYLPIVYWSGNSVDFDSSEEKGFNRNLCSVNREVFKGVQSNSGATGKAEMTEVKLEEAWETLQCLLEVSKESNCAQVRRAKENQ